MVFSQFPVINLFQEESINIVCPVHLLSFPLVYSEVLVLHLLFSGDSLEEGGRQVSVRSQRMCTWEDPTSGKTWWRAQEAAMCMCDVHSPAGGGQQRWAGIWRPGRPGEKGPGAGRPRCKTRPGQWKQSPFLELDLIVQRGALRYWTSKPLGFRAPWFSLMRRETDPLSWSWIELGAGWYVDSVWELEHCGSRWPGRSGDSLPVGVSALQLTQGLRTEG